MFSNKPYLVRAFFEWIVDNDCTPYVVINANFPRCNLPKEFIQNGEITLNISPNAVRDLKISNETIEFRASFSGVVHLVAAPVKAILAIYAQENQEGMFFDYEDTDFDDTQSNRQTMSMTDQNVSSPISRGHLKLVEPLDDAP